MFSQRWGSQLVLSAFCFNFLFFQVSALNVEYCSSLNTATTDKNSSIYQSNGLCYDFCVSNYAFAVLQDDGCWCSNYAPGPGTTTTGCDTACPGYPDDLCGGNSLWGYIALTNAPLGTEGASSAAASSTSSAAAQSTKASSSTPLTTSSAKGVSTSSTSSMSSPPSTSSTWTPTPITSLETVTGQVRTVTITPTSPPNSGSTAEVTKNKKNGGLSVGAAVGLTIGLVALIAIISAIIFFCIRKRRELKAEEYNNVSRRGSSAGLGSAGAPSRTMSQNSKFVLNTDGRQVVERWEPGEVPGLRSSRLMPVDPRLDPFAAVYQRGENKSRESINTIRDDHDYSRRVAGPGPILRATNPDAAEDTEE